MNYLSSQLNLQSLQTLRAFGPFVSKGHQPRKRKDEALFVFSNMLGLILLIFLPLQAGQCLENNISVGNMIGVNYTTY